MSFEYHKSRVTFGNQRVDITATFEYKGQTWIGKSANFKGPVFREQLAPLKQELEQLEAVVLPLARVKFIALAEKQLGKQAAASADLAAADPDEKRQRTEPERLPEVIFNPNPCKMPSGSRQGTEEGKNPSLKKASFSMRSATMTYARRALASTWILCLACSCAGPSFPGPWGLGPLSHNVNLRDGTQDIYRRSYRQVVVTRREMVSRATVAKGAVRGGC
jgi:hypothetical protein